MYKTLKEKFNKLSSDKNYLEILSGSAWALGARILGTAMSTVISIIIARCYGAEILGIVAVLNSFLMLSTIFTILGTNTSILRLIPEHLAKYSYSSAFRVYRKIQYFVAGVSIITGIMLFVGSGFIAETLFCKPYMQIYFKLGSVFIVFQSLMSLNTHAVRGVRLIRTFAFMQILPTFSKLIILVLLTVLLFHPDNPVYAMFSSITITAFAGAWIMDRIFKKKSKSSDTVHIMPIKQILSISTPMLMASTMNFVIGQTGVVMLGMFRSESEVGYYAIAVKLASLTGFILTAINSIAAPKFSELYHSEKTDELFQVAKKSTKLIFWAATPILLCLITMGKPIISILYGADFTVAYGAMLFLVVGQFVNSVSGSTGFFMNMTGHQKMFRNIVAIAAFINIILSYLLIPEIGIKGAAIAGMVSLSFWNVTTLIYIRRKFGKTIAYLPFL